jgi:hypothetical protein
MKQTSIKSFINIALVFLTLLLTTGPDRVCAQVPWLLPPPPPPLPVSQRQVLNQLQQQLRWLDSSTRTATMFNTGADVTLWNQYDALRVAYGALKNTLTPWQVDNGANELAELDAGLDIIGQAFGNFQDDLNGGRNATIAFRTLSQVLRDSTRLWGQEFNRMAMRLRIGR